MTYNILATGSTGNAVIIDGKILIDCGIPYKLLEPHVSGLRLVCLTHIHGDHFNKATIKKLAHERPAIRFACCEWLVEPLKKCGVKPNRIDLLIPDFYTIYSNFSVCPVLLTHNVPNCGFRIESDGAQLFYATDTGTLDGIKAQGYDLYLVEANHTHAELEERIAAKEAAGEYAYEVQAAQNHLSFEQAVDWLSDNMSVRSVWVPMHGHIEKNKKTEEKNNGTEGSPANRP